jgi:hypothetical protein
MLKLISVKTRRPDLSRAEFRRHYEGRHVPLGLGYVERFRWRKYARNHVVAALAGEPGFDCLTEFWLASAHDQARTREFVGSAEFGVLDEDDRRFLDVGRRLSFEVEEHLLAGAPRAVDPAGTRRVARVLRRPRGVGAEAFARDAADLGRRFAAEHPGSFERITLDQRLSGEPGELEMAAILSLWPKVGAALPTSFGWPEAEPRCTVVDLEVVETPPEALFRASDGDAA